MDVSFRSQPDSVPSGPTQSPLSHALQLNGGF